MDITQLIADKLDSLYNFPVYRENIDGGFAEPSFFVQRAKLTVLPGLFSYQKRVYRCHVIYFPPKQDSKEACDNMAELLAADFQQIDGVGRCFGREFQLLESEPPNAELHFSFGLEVLVKPKDGEKFNRDLEIQTGTKGAI